MKIITSLVTLLIFLGSCANYNSIQFGSKNNQSVAVDASILDIQKESPSGSINNIDPTVESCDTVFLKDGTFRLYRIGRMGVTMIDVKGCQSEIRGTVKLSKVEKIKFSNGIIWPPIDQACDTIYLMNGYAKILKCTYMSDVELLGFDCTSKKQKTKTTKLSDIKKIHFADNRIWMNDNSISRSNTYCDTILYKSGVVELNKVGNKGVKRIDLINCETNKIVSTKIDLIESIKYSNGNVWPNINQDSDTIYTSKGKKILINNLYKDVYKISGKNSEDDNKKTSIRLVKIESVHYSNGNVWVNEDVNDKSKDPFYKGRKALIILGSILMLPLSFVILLLFSDVS